MTTDLGGTLLRRTVHPSGLRVLTEQMPGARSTTIGFWVGVGSRDEQAIHDDAPGSLGSTHFLEHLLFKGTPTRDAYEIATSFDRIGAEHNALTAKEYTCYYAKVRDADVDTVVLSLADMVLNSTIAPEDFETERGVILEELAMASDDLADVASEHFFENVFGSHALARPIGGNPESIKAARRNDVVSHYKEQYNPSTLVVAAAGAIDHDRLVEQVLDALRRAEDTWNIEIARTPIRRSAPTHVPLQTSGTTQLISRQSEQVNLMLGGHGIRATDPRRFAFGLMNSVLGGGMSSRLFQEIREKRGMAYSVYSFGASYSDEGLFGIYAGTMPQNTQSVIELSRDVLQSIAEQGISEAERERALGQIAGSAALALEDSDTRMGRLARAEIGSGELFTLDASLERFEQVTHAEVREIAAYIAEMAQTVVAVGDTTTIEHSL